MLFSLADVLNTHVLKTKVFWGYVRERQNENHLDTGWQQHIRPTLLNIQIQVCVRTQSGFDQFFITEMVLYIQNVEAFLKKFSHSP